MWWACAAVRSGGEGAGWVGVGGLFVSTQGQGKSAGSTLANIASAGDNDIANATVVFTEF